MIPLRADRKPEDPLEQADFFRLDVVRRLAPKRRAEMGQFFTPAATARLMASMFTNSFETPHLLDAGAGVGALTAAWVEEICGREKRPTAIEITAYEVDTELIDYLRETLAACERRAKGAGIELKWEVIEGDFIDASASMLRNDLFSSARREFTSAILNPPYRKIHSESAVRQRLQAIGVETGNLYTAFLALAVRLLVPGGEVVAISPRSFCNGPYYRSFRSAFLKDMTMRRIHVFDSREHAFKDDEVLQENVILHAVKGAARSEVVVSSSTGPEDDHAVVRDVPYDSVVKPNDPDAFIYIAPDGLGDQVGDLMQTFSNSLIDLDLEVSTGRVVDFRATDVIRERPGKRSFPLIYPVNLKGGFVQWPVEETRKAQALADVEEAQELLVPTGWYAVTKRFSAKEERRRLTAAVYDPSRIKAEQVGFENHLNYYHRGGKGLPKLVAKGLVAFLNSRLVDLYFRQFSGHTQVNATDLRSLRYPPLDALERLGKRIGDHFPEQGELDRLIEDELLPRAAASKGGGPIRASEKIEQALAVLRALGLPRAQQNERSALVLLALVALEPDMPWSEARSRMVGVTPAMDFIAEHYGKKYAPNTRETVRRQTLHQFLDAGVAVLNPDDPSRAINSAKNVYQIDASTLELLRTFGTEEWDRGLRAYLASGETLKARYAQERVMARIPLTLASGKEILLSPGGQNVLVKEIIEQFCPRFTPGAIPLYVGDTDEKWAFFDQDLLRQLGVEVDAHGKMPDVVIFDEVRNWLILIEAVTSHGPVNPKRHRELAALFKGSSAGLVYVTAFLDRRTLSKYLDDISWETEVWAADSPSHLIHFNGERFLGPH